MLWAWERPEDLRGADPGVGIAFLAQTVTLAGDQLLVTPRRQRLRVAPGATMMAVTRVEPGPGWTPRGAPLVIADALAAAIAATARLPRVRALQIDFDARRSQRAFYGRVLGAVRREVGDRVPISITALASWCVGDPWLAGLPVDEAVPMLFAMGPVEGPFRAVAASRDAAVAECRGALGLALDEPLATSRAGRRLYVFSNEPWNDTSVAAAVSLAAPDGSGS